MFARNGAFKRVGAPKAIAKDADGFLTIQISLDGNPNWDWIECFKSPSNYISNEAHPSKATVAENRITFKSSESSVKVNIGWMNRYIQQANDCYSRRVAERLAEEKRQQEIERKQKEELSQINETLKDL